MCGSLALQDLPSESVMALRLLALVLALPSLLELRGLLGLPGLLGVHHNDLGLGVV